MHKSVLFTLAALAALPHAARADQAAKAGVRTLIESGTVVDASSKPVSNADVSFLLNYPEDKISKTLATVKTDASGAFEFHMDVPNAIMRGSSAQLLVTQGGRTAPAYAFPKIAVTLPEATSVQLHFLDSDGKPAAHVRIEPQYLNREPHEFHQVYGAAADRWSGVTDDTGTITISGLPQGFDLTVDARDDRYAHLTWRDRITLGSAPTTAEKTIRLTAGGAISGHVSYGAAGKPAARVKIDAQTTNANIANGGWGEAVTDANGDYRITQLSPSVYNVSRRDGVEHESAWTAVALENVFVKPGEVVTHKDLTLIHGVVVTGRVTERGSGKPMAFTEVGIYGPAHPQSSAEVQMAVTGPDGRYQARVPAGRQYVYVMSEGDPGPQGQKIAAAPGKPTVVNFAVPKKVAAKSISGVVLGMDKNPAPGADVIALLSKSFKSELTTKSDDQGRFHFDGADLTPTVSLYARRGADITPAATLSSGEQDVSLHLAAHAGGYLTGVVTDQDRKPMANATVSLYLWRFDMGSSEGPPKVTDAEGRYQFGPLFTDVRYSVGANAVNYSNASGETISLSAGETRTLPALTIARADSFVAGTVVDERGAAVSGAVIHDYDVPETHATTDENGKFRLNGVPSGKLTLTADLPERHINKDAMGGQSDVIMVLPPARTDAQRTEDDSNSREAARFAARNAALPGKPAPALRVLQWVNSKPLTLAALRGKIVVVDFWGIGCGPCVAGLPGVQSVWEQYRSRGVVVIGLHNAGVAPAELRRFAADHRLTYPLAIDAPDKAHVSFGKSFTDYAVQGIPSVAVIGRDGKVAAIGNSMDEAVQTLDRLTVR